MRVKARSAGVSSSTMAVVVLVAQAAAVALLSACALADDPEQCGLYNTVCADYGQNKVSTSLVVSGAYTGDIELVTETFSDGTCNSADVSIQASGTWSDLGVDKGVGRFWQVTYDEVQVTPNTKAWADKLNKECPCDGNWKAGKQRTLLSCVPGTCDNTEWLGGLTGDQATGVEIGVPAFGFSSSSKKEIALSFLDSSYSIGLGLTQQDVWQTVSRVGGCGETKAEPDYCGVWTLRCTPSFVYGARAHSGEFVYEGPVNDEYASGIYKNTVSYFTDSACTQEHLTVQTEATFATNGVNINIDGADMVKYNAPYVLVTPHTDATANMLRHDCPCGDADAWKTKKTRRLTSCTLEQCNVEWWNNKTLTGNTFHGNVITVTRNDSSPELRLTPVVDTTFQAKNQGPDDLGRAYILSEDTCKYPYDSLLEICGKWEMKCSSTVVGDEEIGITITGSAGDPSHGEGTGVMDRERLIFKRGTECSDEPKIMLNDVGFWTDMGNSTTVPGARNILIRFAETTVEIFDNDTVALLNNHFDGCPCNGTWKMNEPRLITKCPPDTCPDRLGIFGNGAAGTPGYGLIRDQEDLIRMSSLHENPTDGFAEFLQLGDYPLQRSQLCDKPEPETSYKGTWLRPCDLGDAGLDFSGVLEIQGSKYQMNYTFFPDGYGCIGREAVRFTQHGHINFGSSPDSVPNGRQVTLKPKQFEVTPMNQEAVTALTEECPCSVGATIWAVNRTISFKEPCPPNTCNNFAFLRQPLGGNAYGVILRYGNFLRMTKLISDKQNGFAQTFTAKDFYWVMLGEAPSSGSHSGIDAGGVLLLIAFFGALAYLAGGMVFNYSRTGVPRIPHAEFWTSLPGLISEGFAFSLSGCGLLRRQKSYAAMTNVESDTSGYGAL